MLQSVKLYIRFDTKGLILCQNLQTYLYLYSYSLHTPYSNVITVTNYSDQNLYGNSHSASPLSSIHSRTHSMFFVYHKKLPALQQLLRKLRFRSK